MIVDPLNDQVQITIRSSSDRRARWGEASARNFCPGRENIS